MNRNYTLFSIFAVVFGAIAATHTYTTVPIPDGLSCTSKRMASYGYTHKRISMAEFAAIVIWQRDTERRDPGFGNWHLAHKRKMKCKIFQNSAHYQCVVSAQPCRFDKS
jgi:hypothetical protein